MNTNEFIFKAQKTHGNKYDYSKVKYTNTNTKVTIVCPIHGEFKQTPKSHLVLKSGCFKCHTDKCRKKYSHTNSEFIRQAQNTHGNKYDYSLTKYINNITKVKIICPIHGEFEQTPRTHKRGGCPKCKYLNLSNRFSHTNKDFITKAQQVHDDKYDYSKVQYVNSDTKIIIICPIHGEFKQAPARHLSGDKCPKCKFNKLSKKFSIGNKEFIARAKQVHGNKYDYSNIQYSKLKNKITIRCPRHGDFTIAASSHLRGAGCHKCSISSIHTKLIPDIPNVVINDRKTINPYEIDILIPDFKLGIECHGLYWHSYNRYETAQEKLKHSNKKYLCLNNDINLLQFFENEIKEKPDIVASIINNKLNRSQKIYARKCKIITVNNHKYKKFMNDNHIQGHIGATIKYGLLFNDKLVCCMSMTYKNNIWEIARLATILNHHVIGGVSKLFNHFIKTHKPKTVITYADRRYSNGDVYKKLGFKLSHITKPNYWYVYGDTIYSRQQFQKHKLHKKLKNFDAKLSETKNMFNHGYRRLWDAGHYKFVKTFQ